MAADGAFLELTCGSIVGGKILRHVLPPNWTGTCATVQLAIPFTLAFEGGKKRYGNKGT